MTGSEPTGVSKAELEGMAAAGIPWPSEVGKGWIRARRKANGESFNFAEDLLSMFAR